MSIEVMKRVWKDGPSDQSELLVLLAIADHADDAGMAYPSMIGLAEKCRVTERGARGIVRRLEAGGWIKTEVGGGRGGKSKYYVLDRKNRNEKPGMENPEPEKTRNVTTQNPERDDTKPGTSVPPNHQGTIKEPSSVNNAREVAAILEQVASHEASASFIAYRRKRKGGALTVTAARRLAAQLGAIAARGGDPDDALGMAEERGWQSMQADWYFNARGQHGNANFGAGHSAADSEARIIAFAARAVRTPSKDCF